VPVEVVDDEQAFRDIMDFAEGLGDKKDPLEAFRIRDIHPSSFMNEEADRKTDLEINMEHNGCFGVDFQWLCQQHFIHRNPTGSLFHATEGKLIQSKPVYLKDAFLEAQLISFLNQCDDLRSMLPTKSRMNGLNFEQDLKSINEVLRRKIIDLRHNGIQKTLVSKLYEMMPATE